MNHQTHLHSASSQASRRLTSSALLSAFVILLGLPCAKAATLITFDSGDPAGGVQSQSKLSNQYAAYGITFAPYVFSGPGAPSGNWAGKTIVTIEEPSTIVYGGGILAYGKVLKAGVDFTGLVGDPSFLVSFSTPVSFFSADFIAFQLSPSTRLFAYNGDTLLGTVSAPSQSSATLSYSAPSITRVIVTPGPQAVGVLVDNIRFQQVPEPGGLSLTAMSGLALLGARRRQAARKLV
ncbi:MAG: hypothetical protein V4726_13620 [Verrucomicrobiota bacterium]